MAPKAKRAKSKPAAKHTAPAAGSALDAVRQTRSERSEGTAQPLAGNEETSAQPLAGNEETSAQPLAGNEETSATLLSACSDDSIAEESCAPVAASSEVSPTQELSEDEHLTRATIAAEVVFPFKGYIAQTEHRGITVHQLLQVKEFVADNCCKWHDLSLPAYSATSGQPLDISWLNLYHLVEWLIKPATMQHDCAFVELLTAAKQTPQWFVSHWWGEPIVEFITCLQRHSTLRQLSNALPYWVCAYANRQHSLIAEVVDDPKQTSFYKAMLLVEGVLVVLDQKNEIAGTGPATPFSRIWCAFEEAVALGHSTARDVPLLLDIGTCLEHRAVVLTEGPTPADAHRGEYFASLEQASRQRDFPIEVIQGGLCTELEKASASVESDRVHILNSIAGKALDAEPPLRHPKYTELNTQLRAIFAIAAWPQAVEQKIVHELKLPDILSQDKTRRRVNFDFRACGGDFCDSSLLELAEGLAPLKDLEVVALNLNGCSCADNGFFTLSKAVLVLPSIFELRLELARTGITDKGLQRIAEHLPQSLVSLVLDLYGTGIGDAGAKELMSKLPASLFQLALWLGGTGISDKTLCDMAVFLGSASLTSLDLRLGGTQVTDKGLQPLVQCLCSSVTDLALGLSFTQIGDVSIEALAMNLPAVLANLKLDFGNTRATNTGLKALSKKLPEKLISLEILTLRSTKAGAKDLRCAASSMGISKVDIKEPT